MGLLRKSFGTLKTVSKFPYKFGGLSLAPPSEDENNQRLRFLEMALSEGIVDGFKYAFQNTLSAIHEKDTTYLRQNLEPLLYDSLGDKLPDTEFVNQQQHLSASLFRSKINFGVSFDRQKTTGYKNMQVQDMKTPTFDFLMHLPKSGFGMAGMQGMLKPPIIQIQILFRSRAKLALKDGVKNNSEQTHLMQFETVSQKGGLDLMNLMSMMNMAKTGSNINPKQFMEKLIGSEYSWKISDIDQTLNGNPWA